IHVCTSLSWCGLSGIVTILLLPKVPPLAWSVVLVSGVFLSLAGVVYLASMSSLPVRAVRAILNKVGFPSDKPVAALTPDLFVKAFSWRLLGYLLNLIEIYLVLSFLGADPSFLTVWATATFIAFTSVAFFMIPQGL